MAEFLPLYFWGLILHVQQEWSQWESGYWETEADSGGENSLVGTVDFGGRWEGLGQSAIFKCVCYSVLKSGHFTQTDLWACCSVLQLLPPPVLLLLLSSPSQSGTCQQCLGYRCLWSSSIIPTSEKHKLQLHFAAWGEKTAGSHAHKCYSEKKSQLHLPVML